MLKVLLFSLFFNISASETLSLNLPAYTDNKDYTLTAKNHRATLINFWASWCTSCIQEIPELEALKKKYKNVEFLAVNAGDSKRKIKKFLKKTGFSYKILMDKNKKFSKSLGILNLPRTLIINSKREVIYSKSKPPKKI